MNETLELVHFDGEETVTPRVYRRTYFTAKMKARTRFYGVLTDWQGIRRKISLGKDFKRAIQKIYEIDKKNHAEVDFDEQKQKRAARGMTFAKFVAECPEAMKVPSTWHLKHVEKFFGSKTIAQISNDNVTAYRDKRVTEKIIKHGEESAKLVSQTTINKEVGTLRKFLRFAHKKGYAHKVTEFKMAAETQRNRVLTDEEYAALLANCLPWLRRACIMAYETCLSRSDLFRLTWSEIDTREGIIELKNGRAKTGKHQAVPIFTPELKALISELQAERRRVPNVDGLVLTMDGQPIDKLKFEYHFRKACKDADIKNFTLHDFRHCCITRWATAGVPTAAAMLAAGHSSVASHKRYQNLTKSDLKAAFGVFTTRSQEKSENENSAASA
jgi:integrase